MMTLRYFIHMAYDGGSFHGWQRQPNALTVQETVEDCLAQLFQQPVPLTGAGRTDTGVHARQFFAHFDWTTSFEQNQLVYRLNRMLPPTIVIKNLFEVPPQSHARFDAVSREYKYYVCTEKDPFRKDYACFIRHHIAMSPMNEACDILKKHRNFQCFSKVRTQVKTFRCEIERAIWEREGGELIFTIVADRFLRNMVRAIVGTMLEIGVGKRPLDDFESVIESRDRRWAGQSIAAKGLFLHKITYPEHITPL